MGEKANTPDPGSGQTGGTTGVAPGTTGGASTTGGAATGSGTTAGGGSGGNAPWGGMSQSDINKAIDQLPSGFSAGGETSGDGHPVATNSSGDTAVYQNGSWVNTGTGEIYNPNPGVKY